MIRYADQAFKARSSAVYNERAKALRESLDGLDDKEKIQAFAYWMFERDEKDGRMRAGAGDLVGNFFREDPTLIEDLTELKKMLKHENDVRRFFILVGMASPFVYSRKEDFVESYVHMIYRDGLVSKTSGDYYQYSHTNISYFTYEIIMRNLEALEAGFQAPDEKLPYEKRIPILIRWLKENWPGCEDLKIPDEVANQREVKHPGVTTPFGPVESGNGASVSPESSVDSGTPSWIWASLVTLSAALAGVVAWRVTAK